MCLVQRDRWLRSHHTRCAIVAPVNACIGPKLPCTCRAHVRTPKLEVAQDPAGPSRAGWRGSWHAGYQLTAESSCLLQARSPERHPATGVVLNTSRFAQCPGASEKAWPSQTDRCALRLESTSVAHHKHRDQLGPKSETPKAAWSEPQVQTMHAVAAHWRCISHSMDLRQNTLAA